MDFEVQNRQIFAKEVNKYADSHYWRPDEDAVINRFCKHSKMLVIGCGGGRTLSHLKNFKLTAIDVVPEMVEVSKKKYPNIPIFVMDACDLKFDDNSFNCVFFPFNGINYIYPDIYKAIKEIKRVLNKDGVFIFSSHNRFYLKKLHKVHETYSSYQGLMTYKTSFVDLFRLRKLFDKVYMFGRTELWKQKSTFKDRLYSLFPFLDKYSYFVCIKH